MNTVMRCRPVSSKFIAIRLRAVPFSMTVAQAQRQTMMAANENNFMTSYRMLLMRHRRRTLLCKETDQKLARMLMKIGKGFADPAAMMTQMREDSDFWSLPPLTILCWRTLLVITKHLEDGPGIAQIDSTPTRSVSYTHLTLPTRRTV